jgi:hypothetical protein
MGTIEGEAKALIAAGVCPDFSLDLRKHFAIDLLKG